jgi:hypothetical protein
MGRASAKPHHRTGRQSWLVALLTVVLLASQFPTRLLFSALVPSVALGVADVLYGVNAADDGLSVIDPATGQVTFIGRLDPDTTKMTTPIAMGVRPSDKKIFVWNNSDTVATGDLVTVNTCSGLGTKVNPSGAPQGQMGALAFAADGTLYGTDSELYRIDTTTGVKTLVGTTLGMRVGGADFDPVTGVLYGAEFAFGTQHLVTINTTTGVATTVATLNVDVGLIGSIVFTASGVLLGTSPDTLFDIDKTTGVVSNQRPITGGFGPQGMGFAPPCVPGTVDGTASCDEGTIRGGRVELYSGTVLVATTTSDSDDGTFEFTGVAAGTYSLRYISQTEGGSSICGASVTFDGTTTNVTEGSDCIDWSNRHWPDAKNLTLAGTPPTLVSGVTVEHLCMLGQSAWFKVHIEPGARLVAKLTGPRGGPLPANYDLLMFKDIQAELDKAIAASSGTATAQDITAQFAGDSFGGDSFGGDSFGGDSFGGDSFGGDSFGGDSFGGDSFGGDSFGGDSFGGDSFGGDSFGGDSFGGDSFGGDSFGGDSFGGDSFGGDSFGGLDPKVLSAVVARSVIGVSAHEGTSPELLWHNTWTNTGDFYLRVHGRHGAFSLAAPFEISVALLQGVCSTVNPWAATTVAPPAGGYSSLILTNTARFGTTTDLNALKLVTLASDTNGYVANLSGDAALTTAYAQWDSHLACPYAANVVTDGIKEYVQRFITANPGTNQVIFAGSDKVIPFRRVPDIASLAKESLYVPPVFDSSATQATLRLGYFMTQDFYTSFHPITRLDHEIYLPDLPTGRLVETPSEIAGMVDAYHQATGFTTSGGRGIAPTRGVVTGYNFFSDEARDMKSQLEATGKSINKTLTGAALPGNALIEADSTTGGVLTIGGLQTDPGAWTATDLRNSLGTNPQLLALNAHITRPDQIVAANGSPLVTNDILAMRSSTPNLLKNSFVWTASCHSSFNIPDADQIPTLTPAPEAAQMWAQLGATVVGGTGYQYGETEIIDYTERILVNLVTELRYDTGPIWVGNALANAKRSYAASVIDFKGIHEKSILEATVFGVPSFSVDLGTTGRLTRPPDLAPFGLRDLTTISLPGQVDLQAIEATVNTSLNRNDVKLTNTTGTGTTTTTYFGVNAATATFGSTTTPALSAGLQANPGQPVLPLTTLPLHIDDTVLPTGAIFLRGSFTDTAGLTPLTAAPGDQLATPHPQFYSETFSPQRIHSINYLAGERLAYTPAQYESGIGANGQRLTNGTMRTYTSAGFRLFYSGGLTSTVNVNGTDFPVALADAPAIINAIATRAGGNVQFEVITSALPGIGVKEVYVTFTKKTSLVSGNGTWESLLLTQSTEPGQSTHWTKTVELTEDPLFFVQSVSGSGRVRVSTNFGAYYGITPEITTSTPKQDTSLTFVTPPTSAISRHPITVSAKLLTNETAHAPLAGKRILFTLNAERAVGYTSSTGLATVQFAVSATPRVDAYNLTAAFEEDAGFLGSSAIAQITVSKDKPILTLTVSPLVQLVNGTIHLESTLTDSLGRRLREQTVFFLLTDSGTGDLLQAVGAETDLRGIASADLVVTQPLGVYGVASSFAGVFHLGSNTIDTTNSRFMPVLSEVQYLAISTSLSGFVSGGGWINSPAGAYRAVPTLAGRANFGFVAKYEQKGTVLAGETEFQFQIADFRFHSESYDWLQIAGPKAQYKGIGTVNGSGNYGFMLTATDGQLQGGGGVDRFRIKIWNRDLICPDTNPTCNIVYDNQFGSVDGADPTTAIAGGSIVIKK